MQDTAAITSRQYTSEADYAMMRQLLIEIYPLNGGKAYCSVGELDWWRGTADDPYAAALSRLWLHGDQVVGIAWPRRDEVDLMVHPNYKPIEDEMLAWAEQRRVAEAGEPLTLTAWVFESDTARIDAMQRRGYQRGSRFLFYHLRDLENIPTEARLPEGYAIRNVQGEADLEARVAVHRAAFAPSRMSVEKHRRVMSLPTYRPDLDLVIVAPDGSFAAFCIVWYDAANRVGTFEPVGCHPDHQRRGLSRAMMYEGLRRLKQLGAQAANVSSHDEPAAVGLYRAVGFRMIDRNYGWKK